MEEMTLEDYLALKEGKKGSKWRNKPVEMDGHKFDSGVEARRYLQLTGLHRNGYIDNLVIHPVYTLIPAFTANGKKHRAITYEGDFEYSVDGKTVCEDVKGETAPLTEVFKIKQKMMAYFNPDVELRIVRM